MGLTAHNLALQITMRRTASILAVVGALLFSAGFAWADFAGENIRRSFDCDKASTKVEHAICASDEISALDRVLADAYKVAKGLDNSTTLRDEQRQWNKERSVQCPGEEKDQCLRTVYLKRFADLVEYSPQQVAKIRCSDLSDPYHPANEEAYLFGWQIQRILQQKNLVKFYTLVSDDEKHGPPESFSSREVWNCGSDIPVEIVDSGWQGWKIIATEEHEDPVNIPFREYSVARTLPFSLCLHFGFDCLELKPINLGGNSGGTLYLSPATFLYGSFGVNEDDLTVTALKIFRNETDARNRLDTR